MITLVSFQPFVANVLLDKAEENGPEGVRSSPASYGAVQSSINTTGDYDENVSDTQ